MADPTYLLPLRESSSASGQPARWIALDFWKNLLSVDEKHGNRRFFFWLILAGRADFQALSLLAFTLSIPRA
jgi:hypothetical protein